MGKKYNLRNVNKVNTKSDSDSNSGSNTDSDLVSDSESESESGSESESESGLESESESGSESESESGSESESESGSELESESESDPLKIGEPVNLQYQELMKTLFPSQYLKKKNQTIHDFENDTDSSFDYQDNVDEIDNEADVDKVPPVVKNKKTKNKSKDKTSKDKTSKDKTSKDKTSKDKTSKDKTSKDKTSKSNVYNIFLPETHSQEGYDYYSDSDSDSDSDSKNLEHEDDPISSDTDESKLIKRKSRQNSLVDEPKPLVEKIKNKNVKAEDAKYQKENVDYIEKYLDIELNDEHMETLSLAEKDVWLQLNKCNANNKKINTESETKSQTYRTNLLSQYVAKSKSVFYDEIIKRTVRLRKEKQRNQRVYHKVANNKHTVNDDAYFNSLGSAEQNALIKKMREINTVNHSSTPYRIQILENNNIPISIKSVAIDKITSFQNMESDDSEYSKLKYWIETFMRIPFGVYKEQPVTIGDGQDKCHEFMTDAQDVLNTVTYGLDDAKMQILQYLGQLVSNPKAIGTSIAIQGPMGTGKTTLVREGISKILNRPFAFIALGGATDSSFLEGHSYTYVGSVVGKIIQIIIDSKCMNPVIYFDELDKISDTPKGEEITGILTHLTDTTQNSQFHDKYFSELDFDLSKCLFIFSYNDESKINPILRDRMYHIRTQGYERLEKTIISKLHLMPNICQQVHMELNDVVISDEIIHYIIDHYCVRQLGAEEHGVRNLKRYLEIIYSKINLYRLVKPGTSMCGPNNISFEITFPFTLTRTIVDGFIKNLKKDLRSEASMSMYV